MNEAAVRARIHVVIRGFMTYRARLGARSRLEVEAGSRVCDLIRLLGLEAEQARGGVHIMVNGIHSSHMPDQWTTVLQDGDEIAIFPPMAGG